MDSIAVLCGFSKTVLYQHFKSKEELFISIFYEPEFTNALGNINIIQSYMSLHDVLKSSVFCF